MANQTVVLGSRRLPFTDLADIQEHFHANGWTDGLPIVPPTAEAVEAALGSGEYAGTSGEVHVHNPGVGISDIANLPKLLDEGAAAAATPGWGVRSHRTSARQF